MNPLSIFSRILTPLIYGLPVIAILAVVALIVARRSRKKEGEAEAPLYAEIIDPRTRVREVVELYKVTDTMYVAKTSPPKIVVLTERPEECVYRTKWGRKWVNIVICRPKDWRLVPIDVPGSIDARIVEQMAGVRVRPDGESSTAIHKILAELMTTQKELKRKVVLAPDISLVLCANPSDVMTERFLQAVEKTVEIERHFLNTVRQSDKMTRLIEAMSKFMAGKWNWLWYVIMGIAIIGIIGVIMMSVMR